MKEMDGHGPCCHCGISKTSLWRNGPPSKPVLCNACGYRWMKKCSLNDYTPTHSRVSTPPEDSDNNEHGAKVGESSSSYEPSKTGSTQRTFWESPIPSRKRTSHQRRGPSFVEKLRNDLYDILQQEPSLQIEEDVLIYKKEGDPNAYFETSLGSILFKRPRVDSAEENAEGSSLDTKNTNDDIGKSQKGKFSTSTEANDKAILDIGEGEEAKVIKMMGEDKEN